MKEELEGVINGAIGSCSGVDLINISGELGKGYYSKVV